MLNIFGYHITILQALGTVFGIGILVFIHELGHFMMAKFFNLKVEAFAFGFGREILGFTSGETRYSINIFPAGGYVKMPGEDIDSASGDPREFMSAAWYKRIVIAAFGPFMNYLLAVALFTSVIYLWGLVRPSPFPLIGQVLAGYPAEVAGVQKDDKILMINDKLINTWEDMAESIHKFPGQEVKLVVQRKDKKLNIAVIPKKDTATGYGLIGIAPAVETQKMGLGSAAALSCKMVVFQSVFTLRYLGEKIVRLEKPELSGPIGVISVLADAAKTGLPDLLHLLAVISVALGLFNLLPIPLVDGGHILTAMIEFIIRRPIDKKIIRVSNVFGLALIAAIFLFATYSDISRLGWLNFEKLFSK